MNQRQTVAMWVGVAVVAAILLFPPWVRPRSGGVLVGEGFAPLWNRPIAVARVDVATLLAEWAVVVMITGAAIVTLKDK